MWLNSVRGLIDFCIMNRGSMRRRQNTWLGVIVHVQGDVGLDQDYSPGDGEQPADSRSVWKVRLTVVEIRATKEPCHVLAWASRWLMVSLGELREMRGETGSKAQRSVGIRRPGKSPLRWLLGIRVLGRHGVKESLQLGHLQAFVHGLFLP